MTVQELIDELQKCPDKSVRVIMQKDSEGNGYSPLAVVDPNCIYESDNTWSGDVLSTEWTWEEACAESSEEWEERKSSTESVVVLAPVN